MISSQICIYFCKDLYSYRVLSVPGKKSDSEPSSIFILIILPAPCYYYALDVKEIRVHS